MKTYQCFPLNDGSGRYVISDPSGRGFAHTAGFRVGQQDRKYARLVVDALNAYVKPAGKRKQ